MIFCPKRLREFFDLRGFMNFLSREVAFFCPERLRDFFCPKRLHDFFVKRLHGFFLSRQVA